MFIVISSPVSVPHETKGVKALLSAGLESFHLRKPDWSEEQVEDWLGEFSAAETGKMVIHRHYAISSRLPVKGVHFSSQQVNEQEEIRQRVSSLKRRGQTASASFHTVREAEEYPVMFDYVFLSPVFDSFSKEGYKENSSLHTLPEGMKQKSVALGGISSENIQLVKNMGYAGAAVLGAIWKGWDGDTENLLKKFKELNQQDGKGQALFADHSRF